MRKKWVALIGIMGWALLAASSLSAHASLIRATPPPNAVLPDSPAEIRLWFTERLEPEFSRIALLDSSGTRLEIPSSTVDPTDPAQMILTPGDLPDGLYTVSWRALSAADGHSTQGSFPITIGAAVTSSAAAQAASEEAIPPEGTLIRWLTLVSMALGVGSIGFRLFVWTPAVPGGSALIERRINRLSWIGWLLLGLGGILSLLLRAAAAADQPIWNALSDPALGVLVLDTRYGQVWLLRMGLWLLMGGALTTAERDRRFYGAALALGMGILLAHSLFSHAGAAPDAAASVTADWLHLLGTALWVGGLVQFAAVIGPARRQFSPAAPVVSALVGHFSNFARAAVASLIVTGFYAAWLHVGSLDGLLTTLYGQTLLVKLILFLPLLVIAVINLIFTHRGLKAGREIWTGRLRGLVGVEIVLTLAILGAVGAMTSISPARNTLAVRAAVPPPLKDNFIFEMRESNGLHVHLGIYPGWVGENTFTVNLMGEHDGDFVTDASLIRMRFENLDQNLGRSELRPELQGDIDYVASGANLSLPGEWRIRVTVQRPGQFDVVVDFNLNMQAAPPPPPPPVIETAPRLSERVLALLLAGLATLSAGGFFAGERRLRLNLSSGAGLLTAGLFLTGAAFLVSGVQAMQTVALSAPLEAFIPSGDDPVRLFAPYKANLPHLLTADGELLQPGADGTWQAMTLNTRVNDMWISPQGAIWAATGSGLQVYRDGAWQPVDDLPAARVIPVHGYMVTLGDADTLTRIPDGPTPDLKHRLHLDLPLKGQPASEMVMLGSHQFVLQSGDALFRTGDEGVSWTPLDTPAPVQLIGTDAAGNLLAVADDGLMVWEFSSGEWRRSLPLPGDQPVSKTAIFLDRLYAIAGGRLYRQAGNTWETVSLPDSGGAYLVDLQSQYPDTLWVLDGRGARLWSTLDGANWLSKPVIPSR